jgi:hypothetical protein
MTLSPKTSMTAAVALAGLAVAAAPGVAQAADTFAGVIGGHRLVTFHSDTIPGLTEPTDIAGLPGGERLVALDAEPSGELLGLGVSGTIYGIDAHESKVTRTVAGFGAQLLPGTRTATLSVAADGRTARVIANGRDKTVDLTSGSVVSDAPAAAASVAVDLGPDGVLRGVDPTSNTVVSIDAAGEHVLAPLKAETHGPTAATTAADGSTWILTGLSRGDQSQLLRFDPSTGKLSPRSSYLFEQLDAIAGTGTAPDDHHAPKVSVRIPSQSVRDVQRRHGFLALVTTSEAGQTVGSARLGKSYRGFGFGTAEQAGTLRVLISPRKGALRSMAGHRVRIHLAIHDWARNTKVVDRYFTLRR